jgi:hypothetical protein
MFKQTLITVALISFISVFAFAQEKPETEKKEITHKMEHMKTDSTKGNMLVRKGEIDLKVIDKNKDGKVYQDMMDWNVISDKPGKCPLCGMTLKEVTLNEAKENLIKHGFKVKEDK